MNHIILWLLIPITFSIIIISSSEAYGDFSIHSDEEKTKENLVKYYSKMLDDSFSDEFIDAVSEEAKSGVHWKFFQENNTDPIRFLRTDNVHLPDTKGLLDVWQIDRYENIWINKDGIKYEQNDFGSFKRITPIIVEKTCETKWQVMTRVHCDWDDMKKLEELKSRTYLQAYYPTLFVKPFSEIDNIFAYKFPEIDSRTKFLMDNGLLEFVRGVKNGKN